MGLFFFVVFGLTDFLKTLSLTGLFFGILLATLNHQLVPSTRAPLAGFIRNIEGGRVRAVRLTCDEVVHQRDGDAEDAHQQVADGQVENEEVDYGAHVAVLNHDEADQHIPRHAQQEDE